MHRDGPGGQHRPARHLRRRRGAPAADLRAVVSGPTTIRAGAGATYTVAVTHTGPSTSEELVTVVRTTGLTKPQAAGSTGTGTVAVGGTSVTGHRWTVPALAPGASATVTVSGLVTVKVGGTVSAVAATTSETPDPVTTDNVTRPFVTTVTR